MKKNAHWQPTLWWNMDLMKRTMTVYSPMPAYIMSRFEAYRSAVRCRGLQVICVPIIRSERINFDYCRHVLYHSLHHWRCVWRDCTVCWRQDSVVAFVRIFHAVFVIATLYAVVAWKCIHGALLLYLLERCVPVENVWRCRRRRSVVPGCICDRQECRRQPESGVSLFMGTPCGTVCHCPAGLYSLSLSTFKREFKTFHFGQWRTPFGAPSLPSEAYSTIWIHHVTRHALQHVHSGAAGASFYIPNYKASTKSKPPPTHPPTG